MSGESLTGALTELAQKVGESTGAVTALQREVRTLSEGVHAELRDHAQRIDALEKRNDREDGAAAAAVARLDTRIKILGALIAIGGLIEALR